jgi:hypothetical protein
MVRAKKVSDVRAVFLFKIPSPFFQEEVEKKRKSETNILFLQRKRTEQYSNKLPHHGHKPRRY